jgi:hypothetical protein
LWYDGQEAVANAIGYAMYRSRSHDAVIRVYDAAGSLIETHEHKGGFRGMVSISLISQGVTSEALSLAFHSAFSQARRCRSTKFDSTDPRPGERHDLQP